MTAPTLLACALVVLASATGCAASSLPQMPWEHPSIAQVAPAPPLPLVAPAHAMKAEKGPAPAPYPNGYGATIKPDGKIAFPEGTDAKIKEGNIIAGGSVVATLSKDGEVTGKGLKRRYKFTPDGDLLDGDGHGVRVSPDGGVRGIGGPWHYQDVMLWSTTDGGPWDGSGWRTIAIVSLIVIENLLPAAVH